MPTDFDASALLFAGVVFGLVGATAILMGLGALLRARPGRFLVRTLLGLALAAVGVAALAIAFGAQGYRALTREELAARIVVRPLGPQRFTARVVWPDGREATHTIAGDEVFVDAHILKWKPIANIFGLHTAYELDRIGGRYRSLEAERTAERTVHALAPERRVDLFDLRQRYLFLAPLFDAEYGSASFVPVSGDAEWRLLVSPSGLVLRP